jgi:selenide,water dikinase
VDGDVGALEDAAVLRPPGSAPLVFTVDFITPIVDDPETYGAIAAANSLSDVYAMGGEPQAALSICGFPSDRVPLTVLERIFRGGRDKAAEAGCAIVGGHTVKDAELKYGLCVLGTVDPARVLTQTHARAGDALVLTKPLGFGIVAQAVKQQALRPEDLAHAVGLMTHLNRGARDAALAAGARAATDVTGFGFVNHLHNLVLGSRLAAEVHARAVPVLECVAPLARAGCVPGGSRNNLTYAEAFCLWEEAVSETERLVLSDAQTSGGLLIAVPRPNLGTLLSELDRHGAPAAAVVGEVVDGPPGQVRVIGR